MTGPLPTSPDSSEPTGKVHVHVEGIGLSTCCSAHPYRLNDMPWRCTKCSKVCDRYIPQRQDSLVDQLRDVAVLANQAGCYDAADWIVKFGVEGRK